PGTVIDDHLPADGGGASVPARRAVSGCPAMKSSLVSRLTPRNAFVGVLLIALALLPVYCAVTGDIFLLSLFTRILILAMAAVSLNLIMGFGGMVSFGHAAYLGIGGYAFGILAHEGITAGLIQWPVALIVSGIYALVVGALCLRT